LEKVNTLVVDKTGTLTEGKPKLIDVLPIDGFNAKEFLRLTASLEQNSEHPLAAAIVQGEGPRYRFRGRERLSFGDGSVFSDRAIVQ